MLKIRLSRVGRRNQHTYRLLVCEHTRPSQTGNYIEQVGAYNPHNKDKTFNAERIKYWISKGAQPSDTVHNMLVAAAVITGEKKSVVSKKQIARPDRKKKK